MGKKEQGLAAQKQEEKPHKCKEGTGRRYQLPTATPRCGPGQPLPLLLSMGLLALCRADLSPQPIHHPAELHKRASRVRRPSRDSLSWRKHA